MSPEPTPLDRIATVVRDAVATQPWGSPPQLFAIDGPLDAPEFAGSPPQPPVAVGCFMLMTRELDGHPADALLDLDVPPSWSALGVAAEGNVRRLDDLAAEPTDRARTVVFADRTGQLAGGGQLQSGGTLDGPPPEGHVVDALLRSFGLPTPPPPVAAEHFFAVMWLQAVVCTALDSPRPLTWKAMAHLQPHLAIGEFDWAWLRGAAIDGRWSCAGITPLRAAKLDDGSFARLALAGHSRLIDLMAEARSLLPTSVVRRVRQALRSWDVRLDG